jgi:hypothetical protein
VEKERIISPKRINPIPRNVSDAGECEFALELSTEELPARATHNRIQPSPIHLYLLKWWSRMKCLKATINTRENPKHLQHAI